MGLVSLQYSVFRGSPASLQVVEQLPSEHLNFGVRRATLWMIGATYAHSGCIDILVVVELSREVWGEIGKRLSRVDDRRKAGDSAVWRGHGQRGRQTEIRQVSGSLETYSEGAQSWDLMSGCALQTASSACALGAEPLKLSLQSCTAAYHDAPRQRSLCTSACKMFTCRIV